MSEDSCLSPAISWLAVSPIRPLSHLSLRRKPRGPPISRQHRGEHGRSQDRRRPKGSGSIQQVAPGTMTPPLERSSLQLSTRSGRWKAPGWGDYPPSMRRERRFLFPATESIACRTRSACCGRSQADRERSTCSQSRLVPAGNQPLP